MERLRIPTMLSVSAIIPCFNAESFLAQAIESVHDQTRAAAEIIVVDDASTDGSIRVAERYGARVVRQEFNRGLGAARNAGVRAAKGDLIAWLDADDYWEPHHLATVGTLLECHPTADVAFGATRRFGTRGGVVMGYVPEGPPTNVFWAAFDDWLHTMIGSVTRRAALEEVGGFAEDERYSTDYDIWLRLARSHLFVSTHEVTNNWRWHSTQMSSRRDEQIRAVYRFRSKLWGQLMSEGDVSLAAQVASRSRYLLEQELHRARFAGDLEQLRFLASLIPAVPAVPWRTRLKWAVRSRSIAPVPGAALLPRSWSSPAHR
jgi:glycosyltransferase involved in cell wall biosynthesis